MTKQLYKLKNIATINSGYSFRTKIQNNPKGNTYVIQMRDISDDCTHITDVPHKVDGSNIHEKHFLQKGDVLFMAKGANNFAVCYDEQYKPAVAASAFFVLRLINENVIPAFLCLYINSSLGQNYLKANMAGTYIPNINKSTLNEMELILLSLAEQEKIIALFQIHKKEMDLLGEVLSKKEMMMNKLIKKLITGTIQFKHGK